jgi:hypothetical protein
VAVVVVELVGLGLLVQQQAVLVEFQQLLQMVFQARVLLVGWPQQQPSWQNLVVQVVVVLMPHQQQVPWVDLP